MTDTMTERISALLDSELSSGEQGNTVDQLHRQEELKQTWDRYHLIGDAIRGEVRGRAHPSIAERCLCNWNRNLPSWLCLSRKRC